MIPPTRLRVSRRVSTKTPSTAAITAGIAQGLFPDTFDIDTLSLTNPDQIGQFATQQVTLATLNAGVDTVINGGSFEDNLQTKLEGALLNIASGKVYDAIGDLGYDAGSLENIVLHALTGGAIAELSGGDFKTGAIAAGAGEALVVKLDALVKENPTLLVAAVEATGATAAAIANGDPEDGAYIAGQGARYNYIPHKEQVAWIDSRAEGDPEKELRLVAAACVEIRCSAQFPVGSEQYAFYQQLESLGSSPGLADELASIQQSGEFEYGAWDSVVDNASRLEATYQLGTRAVGTMQTLGGTALAASGAGLAGTGVGSVLGAALVVVGADQAAAGTATVIDGQPAATFGAQGLAEQLDIPLEEAELWYGLAAMGGELGAVAAVSRGAAAGSVVEVPSGAGRAPNARFDV